MNDRDLIANGTGAQPLSPGHIHTCLGGKSSTETLKVEAILSTLKRVVLRWDPIS